MPNPQLDAVAALGDGVEFHGAWLRPRRIGDEIDFVAMVSQRRVADAHAMRDVLEPDEFARMLAEARKPIDWTDDVVTQHALSPSGLRWFARRALDCDDATFEALWSDRRSELLETMAWLDTPTGEELQGQSDGTPITLWDCVILLESRGYRRDDIRRLTRRYVRALLMSDADECGKRLKSKTPTVSYEDQVRHVLTTRGIRPHRIEEIVRGTRGNNSRRR